jgi:hypothetical protein
VSANLQTRNRKRWSRGFLIDCRDAIIRRYPPAVNPIVDESLADGLTFRTAAVDAKVGAAPQESVVTWSQFDNATNAVTPIITMTAPGTNTTLELRSDRANQATVWIRAADRGLTLALCTVRAARPLCR